MNEIKLYLLDIEGTVAPVAFVTETLFAYGRKHFPEFLRQHALDPAVSGDLRLLSEENSRETATDCPTLGIEIANIAEAQTYIDWLMDRDRKSTALKSLQGRVWKSGYESGELRSALYDDVPRAFARWAQQARVAIYSSGSTDAQRLFFKYSDHGDLTPHISGYFDTRTGPKQAGASYAAIAEAMEVEPAQVLFFSDVVKELDAAREAGCHTRLVVRAGNGPVIDANGHLSIESLSGI